MKLALCSCFQDHLVGPDLIADYLLYWLNKHRNFSYLDKVGLEEPTDDITHVLLACATKLGKTERIKDFATNQIEIKLDLLSAAKYLITAFRAGEFGKVCLDRV